VVDAELLRLSTRVPDLDARARCRGCPDRPPRRRQAAARADRAGQGAGQRPGGIDYADALRALFGLGIDADVPADADQAWPRPVTVDPDELRPGVQA
jgi:glutamyl-tRNA reductase